MAIGSTSFALAIDFRGSEFNPASATVPATGPSTRLHTMLINATAIASGVPEPATFGIVLSGIGILALMRGRASRRR